MKTTNLSLNTNKLTNIMIGLFIIVSGLSLLATDVFKQNKSELELKNIYGNPFSEIFLKTTDQVTLKNRTGQFEFKKIDNDWLMLSPRALPANNQKIRLILESLGKISIKTVFHKDEINIQNYSFSNPLVDLTLSSDINKIGLTIGLVNPINQSAFVTFSNIDKIFQINLLPIAFDSLTLAELIDTAIFSFEPNNAENIKIFQFGSTIASLNFSKTGNLWSDEYKTGLDVDAVNQLLTSLKALKSSYILDSISTESANQIQAALQRPLYKITIKQYEDEEEVFIANIPPKVEEIKIDKKNYMIVKSTKKIFPMLLSKDFMYLFTQKRTQFKTK